MRLRKEYRWEMGHRLPDHDGGCKNLHGHSYRLEIILDGSVGENGMVVDFNDISRIVKPMIAELDHAFMVDRADTPVMEFLETQALKTVIVDFPSTVENLCCYFTDRIWPAMAPYPNVDALTVRIFETPNSAAEHRVER